MSSDGHFGPVQIPVQPPSAAERLAEVTGTRPAGFVPVVPTGGQLTEALFRPPQRWGWEYVDPHPVSDYPHLDQYPQWQEPSGPDLSHLYELHRRAEAKQRQRLTWAGGVSLFGLIMLGSAGGFGIFLLLVGVGIGAAAIILVQNPLNEIRRLQQQAEAEKQAQREEYRRVCAQWDAEIQRHKEQEEKRFQATPLLYPLVLEGLPSRVDVFGGTFEGWAAVLTTMGTSALAGGSSMAVLDLSGQQVSGPLAALSVKAGVRVTTATVPDGLARGGLLGDLNPRELADVLAEAISSMRPRTDHVDLQAMDAELIHTVARQLGRPLTFARLAAGVEVLRSTYDLDGDGPLSTAEVRKLTDQVDLVDKSERVRDELRFVGNQLELLAEDRTDHAIAGRNRETVEPLELWPGPGLTVIGIDSKRGPRKEFTDRVLFHAVAHGLAHNDVQASDPVLVVAGADRLGRTSLESLVRDAWGARVRLVYLFEHLREDTEDLLGGSDSVSVLMRLGNGKEALTAAEYIGRGHSFQLSQLTRQLGATSGVGGGTSATETEGFSVSDQRGGSSTFGASSGYSSGHGGGSSNRGNSRSHTDSWSQTLTDSWSTARQRSENWSQSTSTTDGVTYQRSYEFSVEPTEIQKLESTAFIMVDSGQRGRRVVVGDCYPGIAMVQRVALDPR